MSRNTTSRIMILASFATTVFLFQNCSNKSFDSSDLSSASLSGSKVAHDDVVTFEIDNRAPSNSNSAASIQVFDNSLGDGNIVTRVQQKIRGGKAGLRGCTGPMSAYYTGCQKDSEYVLITTAWGAGSYDAANDIYSTDQDVSAQRWPFTQYFTRYIAADGSRTEVTFAPKVVVEVKPARLQWVRTTSTACIGPTPSPAEIGASCSVEGDTRSNACGVATCQFK